MGPNQTVTVGPGRTARATRARGSCEGRRARSPTLDRLVADHEPTAPPRTTCGRSPIRARPEVQGASARYSWSSEAQECLVQFPAHAPKPSQSQARKWHAGRVKPTRATSQSLYFRPIFFHGCIAVSGAVAHYFMTLDVTLDANIGAGMAILWSATAGLPWSIPFFMGSGYGSDVHEVTIYTGCALFNVALHAVWRWVSWRGR